MKKTIVTRPELNSRIIDFMIYELTLQKTEILNNEYVYEEPPLELQDLEDSIRYCVAEILAKVEFYTVMETISSIGDNEIVQIY